MLASRKQAIKKATLAKAAWVAFLLLSITQPAQAAWTQEKGKWFTSQQLSYFASSHFVDDQGRITRENEFRKYEWNSYAEYGWTDRTTLGVNLFLHQLEADDQNTSFSPARKFTRNNFGLADSEILLRHRLWQNESKSLVLSVQPLLKFPSAYEDNQQPLSGTDDFDAELRLQAGYAFTLFDLHHYVKLEGGYRKRFGEWRDQLKLDATLGLRLSGRVTVMPQLFLTQRAEGTGISTTSLGAANDYDLYKGQLSLLYDLTPQTTVQLGAFSHLHARNTGNGDGMLLGIWHRF